jgi:hypothetical protein
LTAAAVVAAPRAGAAADGESKQKKAEETKEASEQSSEEEGPKWGLDGSYIGVGGGFFVENSRREGEQVEQVESTDESYDYTPDGFLNGSLWYLKAVSPRVRVGGGLHYFGGYEAVRALTEDEMEQDEPPDIPAYELGQMVTPYARAEFLVPFLDSAQLVVGAEAGMTMLFPDGDFRQEIREMKDQEISVSTGPRLGVDLGPSVGARWALDDRLALRADFSVHWQRIFLFGVDDTVDGVDYSRDWTAKILRYNLGLAMEVTL